MRLTVRRPLCGNLRPGRAVLALRMSRPGGAAEKYAGGEAKGGEGGGRVYVQADSCKDAGEGEDGDGIGGGEGEG